MSGQIRQDKVSGRWVIYSAARSRRPHDFAVDPKKRPSRPKHDPQCPFCPGHEDAAGKEVVSIGNNEQSWQVRVIENKYPALTPRGSPQRRPMGSHLVMDGFGRHEVVIETPRHDRDISSMGHTQAALVIETYHQRYLALARENPGMMVNIFRNHGLRAGSSLIHPHSQIVLTPMVPRHMRNWEVEALRYFDRMGSCLFCDILAEEQEEEIRLVYTSEHFVVFAPFAAEVPCEMWIMPRRHQAQFGSISRQERRDLARCLVRVLGRLSERLGDPDYNYNIITAAPFRSEERALHWYLRIRPRLTTQAGFEIGSGISINPSLPEQDAAFLRGGHAA